MQCRSCGREAILVAAVLIVIILAPPRVIDY